MPSANIATTVGTTNNSAPSPNAHKKKAHTAVASNENQTKSPSTPAPQAVFTPPEEKSPPVQSQSLVQASSDESDTPVTKIDFSSLEEIKEKVAEAITTGMTKSFLRQQCHIVKIEGATVTIGVTSKGLLNIAKRQQKDLEAGFTQVYGKPMNIFFFADKELKHKDNHVQPPVINQEDTPSAKTIPTTLTEAQKPDIEPSPPVENSSNPPSVKVSVTQPIPENNSSYSAEVVQKAAENLAKSFKGEIVFKETKEVENKSTADNNQITIINRPSVEYFEDEDEDIPF